MRFTRLCGSLFIHVRLITPSKNHRMFLCHSVWVEVFGRRPKHKTSAELPGSIRIRLMSQFPCFTLMIRGSSSWGLSLRAFSSEKIILTFVFPWEILGKPWDITFVTNTCLAYFLWEDLELSPTVKPPAMLFELYVYNMIWWLGLAHDQ